jgi:hypothetical protein
MTRWVQASFEVVSLDSLEMVGLTAVIWVVVGSWSSNRVPCVLGKAACCNRLQEGDPAPFIGYHAVPV